MISSMIYDQNEKLVAIVRGHVEIADDGTGEIVLRVFQGPNEWQWTSVFIPGSKLLCR